LYIYIVDKIFVSNIHFTGRSSGSDAVLTKLHTVNVNNKHSIFRRTLRFH